MWIHLTTGFGWPSGGEQPRMTLSPIVAVVFTGLIRKSLWMSATLRDAYKEENRKRMMIGVHLRKEKLKVQIVIESSDEFFFFKK